MEKTKNKFYVAVAVLDFVFASIFVIYSLIMVLTLSSGSFTQLVEESLAGEYGVGTPELAAQVEMIKTMWTGLTILMIASAAVMYVAGAYFLKYSNLTDHEADEKWGKCLAWTIVSYFFADNTLIVLLAFLALVVVFVIYEVIKNLIKKHKAKKQGAVQEKEIEEVAADVAHTETENVETEKIEAIDETEKVTESQDETDTAETKEEIESASKENDKLES